MMVSTQQTFTTKNMVGVSIHRRFEMQWFKIVPAGLYRLTKDIQFDVTQRVHSGGGISRTHYDRDYNFLADPPRKGKTDPYIKDASGDFIVLPI